MLQVPRLDGDDYKSIFERAKARIPTLTDEWTNFNAADPGITTLETFAWLFDTLHYYMNASGEVHRLRYFKLLGIQPVHRAAECVLALEGSAEIDVPKGARIWAEDIPFETQEAFHGPANSLIAVYLEQNGCLVNQTDRAGVDGGFAPLFSPDSAKGSCLYLGFAQPLVGKVRLYLELEEQGRTPFDERFSLAKLVWEVFDEGWHPVQIENDETCGFLRSGFLKFSTQRTSGHPQNLVPGYYLRCRLEENHYDLTPRLGRVLPCCVHALQVQTWARTEEFVSDGGKVLEPDFFVAENTLVAVFVRHADHQEYVQWCGFSPSPMDLAFVKMSEKAGRANIYFKMPVPAGDRILVTALSPEAAQMAYLGRTDGCAGQRLEIDAENVSELTLALTRTGADGTVRCQLWTQCEDLMCAGWDDCVFQLNEGERSVVFGDSLHGRQPQAGWDVLAVSLRTSRFEGGNVVCESINAPDGVLCGVERVYNPAPAQGGCRRKTSVQMQQELDARMSASTRAVTQEDYRAIALATPGLLLDSVAVIPMANYCAYYDEPFAPNTVIIAVKPHSAERLGSLSETYRRAVENHMEHCRILTTDIRVVSARYVGVSVYGRVRLRPGQVGGIQRIRQVIGQAVDTLNSGEYGRGVDCGRLFSKLELESCVQGVEQLSLEYIGRGGGKNEHGDVVVGPDCLTYLREIGIEYL